MATSWRVWTANGADGRQSAMARVGLSRPIAPLLRPSRTENVPRKCPDTIFPLLSRAHRFPLLTTHLLARPFPTTINIFFSSPLQA